MLSIASFGIISLGDNVLIGISKRKNTTECMIGGKLHVVDIEFFNLLINKYTKKDPICLFSEYLKQIQPIIERMNQIKLNEKTVYKHTISVEDERFITTLFNSNGKSPFYKCEKLLASLTLKRELWEELGGLDLSLKLVYSAHSYIFADNIPNRYVSVFEIDVTLNILQKSEYGVKLLKAHGVKIPIDEIRLMKMNDLNKWVYTGALGVSYDMHVYVLNKDIPPIRNFSVPYIKSIFPDLNNPKKAALSSTSEDTSKQCISNSLSSTCEDLITEMKKLGISDSNPAN
jgi:hypothetical protein